MGFKEYLQDRGLAETAIEYKLGLKRYLDLRFNLWDGEAFREHVKKLDFNERRKNNIGDTVQLGEYLIPQLRAMFPRLPQ